jgi:aspartate/methionine/tyrosine aminotransferase
MRIAPFRLERYFAKYEFNAPYLLCSSDCESLSITELLRYEPTAEEEFKQLWLGYTESAGQPELRHEISKLYQFIQPDQVLVHSGAEEAIFNFMNVLLEPGDHVIVHYPGYQSLMAVASAIGCEVTRWTAQENAGWELDLDFLKANLKPNTKLIVINTPHNPTGYLMSEAKLRQIAEIAAERDIWLFADEVYRFLEHDPADRLPAACDIYPKAVSLGVMSKTFGLAGLRIGWIATRNREIYAAMANFKDYTTICNSAPSEWLSTFALRHLDKVVERNRQIVRDNMVLLNNFFDRHAAKFQWHAPKAGAIAFPRLITGQNIDDFCHDLVTEQGVLLLPATHFEYPGANFRLGFGRKNMPECLQKLDEYLLIAK